MRAPYNGLALLAAAVAACSGPAEPTSPPPGPPPAPLTGAAPFLVSNPVSGTAASLLGSTADSRVDGVAYISLPPGTVSGGLQATIRVDRTGLTVTRPLVDGGFDPVAVPAAAGDTITLTLARAAAGPEVFRFTVPATKAPTIVRTVPPRNKRDVPLNARMVVVFSEPIDPRSLTPDNLAVHVRNTAIAGELTFTDSSQTAIAFTPSVPLVASTEYTLIIDGEIVDRDGVALDAETVVEFTTVPTPDKLAFTSVSAGPKHACGVTTSGAAYCWGDNAWGQLGTGNTVPSASPVPVAGGIAFQQISAAESFTCGVATTGAAFCWGSNADGLLGVGLTGGPESCLVANQVTPCTTTPRNVAGGLAFASVSSHGGAYLTFLETGVYNGVTVQGFTCGVTVPGSAYCWGSNRHVWFAAGGAAPVPMATGLQFASISTGMLRACGVTTSGAGYCWGSNFWGGLGSGTLFTYPSGPQEVEGGHTFRAIATAMRDQTSCGITTSGAGYCWGTIKTPTSPGAPDCVWPDDGSVVPCSVTPLPMSGGMSWSALTLGNGMSCGLSAEGRAYCWGIVVGGTSIEPVATTLRFTSISSGGNYACGVSDTDGAAYCWGYGQYGQLGTGDTASSATTPVRVGGFP